MMKLAIGALCAAVAFGLLSGSVETAIGVSGYIIAAGLLVVAALACARALFGAKSHSFEQRTTEGGFLN